jgi:DNA polymerase
MKGSTKAEKLGHLAAQAAGCQQCPHLAATRTQVVFGVGNPETELMFVGEAPGADEDEQGEPFVGAAGQLLTKMIIAMGLSREQVYIGNVLKCRPDMPAGSSGNRKPTSEEMQTCLPYLKAQIEIIQPKVLVALGSTAVEGLLGGKVTIGKLRGRFTEFQGIPLMPTFHPAYLLRNQSVSEKRKVWEDLLQVMERLGLPINAKQRGYFLKAGG